MAQMQKLISQGYRISSESTVARKKYNGYLSLTWAGCKMMGGN